MPEPLRVACWSFTATDSVRRNRAALVEGIAAAASAGARLLATPECGLTGYPGAARRGWRGTDWAEVRAAERELADCARAARIALVLGTASRFRGSVSNDALLCGRVRAEARYRKRCLTPRDERVFAPGTRPVVGRCAGWRVGLAVCYDVRFPRVFAEMARTGADAFVLIAHMAGHDPDPGTKDAVVPAHCASRAAEWVTPLLLANTAAPDRWLDSGLWDARGMRAADRGEGLLVATLTPRGTLDPWYRAIRRNALGSFFGGKAR